MVLWGMMIMGMAVGGLIQYMRHSVLEDVDASKEYQARLLAESGIALALHPRMKKNDPLLHQQISPVKRYDVTVSTEGARIAINQIATKPEVHAYCQKLFVIWGMNPESSGVLADSLKDWIDADERVSPLGAEDGHYTLRGAPHYPRNEPFRHLDEMLLVRGMHELARRKPNWKDHFTLYGDGKI
ncbi:MAG: general secretion pathway protein GspK, partial [Verrucomicrobiales bacterium]